MLDNKIYPTFFFSNSTVQHVNIEQIDDSKFLYRVPKRIPIPFLQGKKRLILNLPFQFRCRKFQMIDDSGLKEKTVLFIPHDINQREFYSPFFLPPEVTLKLRTDAQMILSQQQKINWYENLLRNIPVEKLVSKLMIDRAKENSKIRQAYYPYTGEQFGISRFDRPQQPLQQFEEQF